MALNLGFADESFSVYDHPKVLIFQNTQRHDADTIQRAVGAAALSSVLPQQALGDREIGLMLSLQDAEAQQRGGDLDRDRSTR